MPNVERREKILLDAPFIDIFKLVTALNTKLTEYQDIKDKNSEQATKLSKEINDIKQTIQLHIIPLIAHNNPQAIEQGMLLLGCNDKAIVKNLINQLITEITNNPLNFDFLYNALAQYVEKTSASQLGEDDAVQIARILTDKMNTIHAPDIKLSCAIIQSLYAVLFKAVEKKLDHLYDNQKAQIRQAIISLKNRLQAVKPPRIDESMEEKEKQRITYESNLIANIKQAIKFSEHTLTQLEDHRTKPRRLLHRLKITGMLFLQAAETGAQCYGAVATMGINAPKCCWLSLFLDRRGYKARQRSLSPLS